MPVDSTLLNSIWTNLSSHIPQSALDDESHRARCLDGTRTQLLSDIMRHLDQPCRSVVWLHGPPGTGKTAVALSLADKLRAQSDSTGSRLAGCFFFPRKDPRKQGLNCVLPAIAYQLGTKNAVVRDMLGNALMQDPGLLARDRTYAHQAEPFFVHPLKVFGRYEWSLKTEQRPPVLIFDGLDRCCSPKEYGTVLHFFKLLVDSLALDHMPNLHIVLTTRTHFSAGKVLKALGESQVIDIQEYSAAPDIPFFLKERLEEIALRRGVQGPLGVTWPSDEDIEKITSKVNGNFGHAERIARFIDDMEPTKQLASVLEQHRVTPPSDDQVEGRKRPHRETVTASSSRSNTGGSEQWTVVSP
ncbi:hypothetical protein CONPUDRAFT_147680 [Coniophora puteana RWD-64-598 SS2]|uniref:Nephrocystin 3-like N-terminal domain-containing protein n=1 Tax=Coniophora puteana (strain RWD-64-598) TaxID=741705 RepID=R7SI56_CONPW|nr:uncharacterized protein CONPUDRAFT_147680 [Coniophora puteana RWD-64-598 SS2]EIW74704.1 hypothetical protein CONPUDRAFT_147680 [Coniophora puteana RWD-64-598 SS2]